MAQKMTFPYEPDLQASKGVTMRKKICPTEE